VTLARAYLDHGRVAQKDGIDVCETKTDPRFSGVQGANYIELARPQACGSNLFTELTSAAACSVLVRFRMPLAHGRRYRSA